MNNEIITTTAAELKIRQALNTAQMGIQAIKDARMKLVFNEDNIETIKAWLDKTDGVLKKVETERVELNKPVLTSQRNINASAKIIDAEVRPDYLEVHEKYSALCRSIQEKKLAEEQEEQRKTAIAEGINNNIMEYSRRISEATTIEQLSGIQSSINLQRTQEKKYGDQLENYCLRLDELNPLLKQKRLSLQQFSKLGAESDEAIHSGNDEAVFELESKKEELESSINEINTKVYETAGKNYSSAPVFVKSILPEVKAKRTSKEWEIVDIAKFAKANPDMVETIVKNAMVDGLMKQYAKEGKFTENSEAVIDGIKYFYKKTY